MLDLCLLDFKDVLNITNLDKYELYNLISNKKFPKQKIYHFYWNLEDVNLWMISSGISPRKFVSMQYLEGYKSAVYDINQIIEDSDSGYKIYSSINSILEKNEDIKCKV